MPARPAPAPVEPRPVEPIELDHHLRVPIGEPEGPQRPPTLAEVEAAIAAARRVGVPSDARVMAGDRSGDFRALHFDWRIQPTARRPQLFARLRGAR